MIDHNRDEISLIEFEIGGFPMGHHKIKLLSTNDGATLVYQEPIGLGDNRHAKYLDNDEWNHFLDSLELCGYAGWKKKYWDNDILDGEQWELIVTYNQQGKVRRYGSNKFPPHWDDFLKAFHDILIFEDMVVELR